MKRPLLSILSCLCTLLSFAQEAYVVLSEDNTTLTFYYDDARDSRTETTFDLNTGQSYPEWNLQDIKKVVFDPTFLQAEPTTTFRWFSDMNELTTIEGLKYLNTSHVTDMGEMFSDCWSLTSLDLSHFDTSNVTNMNGMFKMGEYYIVDRENDWEEHPPFMELESKLSSLNLSGFDTSSVTDMGAMFSCCCSLTSLDLSSFDTSKVKDMSRMFSGCCDLTSLDLSGFDTSSVTDMSNMFFGSCGLSSLDLSSFDTSHVTGMRNMFYGCSSISNLNLSHLTILPETPTDSMLYHCKGLRSLSVSPSFENISPEACHGIGLSVLPCLLVFPEGYDFNVNTSGDSFLWKCGIFSLTSQTPVSAIPYAALAVDHTLTFYYDDLFNTRSGAIFELNTTQPTPEWAEYDISSIIFDPSFKEARPITSHRWFDVVCHGRNDLEAIQGLEYLDTSEMTDMNGMFFGCSQLTSIDLSHFDTSKVKDMGEMFSLCHNLTCLDPSGFNTSNVTNMSGMFSDCWSLSSLDVSGFHTSKVTKIEGMFMNCNELTTIDLSHFDTSNVKDSGKMFIGCYQLQSLKISDMTNLHPEACTDIGLNTGDANPCLLLAPIGYDFGVDTTGCFMWKGGYFTLMLYPTIFVPDMSLFPGDQAQTDISLEIEEKPYTGYQFDLILPEGICLEKIGDGFSYTLSDRFSGEDVSCSILESSRNTYSVICNSTGTTYISGTKGIIISLPFTTDQELAHDIYKGTIKNIILNDDNNNSLYLDDFQFSITIFEIRQGDVNHDSTVDITDILLTVDYILGKNPKNFYVKDADVNGDGVIDISDVLSIVDIILGQRHE